MTGIDDAALLAVVAIGSALGASALPRASWPRRCPAAAILLWQALGLASGLAAVGTLIGLAMPGGNAGVARSVLRVGTLIWTGDVFRADGLFRLTGVSGASVVFGVSGPGGAVPVILMTIRLTCLVAGM